MRKTSRALIIQDDKILMFERWRTTVTGKKLHYFSIPGGGMERDESPEAAVVRELMEEMLITVEPLRLLFVQRTPKRLTYYYHCRIESGTPTFNLMSEEARFRARFGNRYEIAWVPFPTAVERVHHGEYRQVLELLPEILADTSRKTVDITYPSE